VLRTGKGGTAGASPAAVHPLRRPVRDIAAGRTLTVAQLRVLAIITGGAAGALVRAAAGEALPREPDSWPWATFAVNLAGALLLGWLLTRLAERVAPTRNWRFLLGTGFAGALTTFSAFQIEVIELAREGRTDLAVAYPSVSIALGMALAVAGTAAARWGRYR
jgi:CrcB protein